MSEEPNHVKLNWLILNSSLQQIQSVAALDLIGGCHLGRQFCHCCIPCTMEGQKWNLQFGRRPAWERNLLFNSVIGNVYKILAALSHKLSNHTKRKRGLLVRHFQATTDAFYLRKIICLGMRFQNEAPLRRRLK